MLEQLLKAVAELPDEEIGRFTEQVIAIRARRVAPSLPAEEENLLQRINRVFPTDDQLRYDALVAKRRDEALAPDEYDELLRLSDRYEVHDAARIAALSELAQLRGVPLNDLMTSLGIGPHSNA